jgi:Uma2 family endonuclease
MSLPERVYTATEYLALERAAEYKNELVNGRICPMTGASLAHNYVVGNIFLGIRAQLRDGPCIVLISNMRVKVSPTGMYAYPDVVALCEAPELEDAFEDTLLNPAVIIEVLSDPTEKYDRGEKFAHYRKLQTLREYILVAQDKIRIEQYVRHGEHWMLGEISDPAGTLRIETLGCEIALRDIYDGVVPFAAADALVESLP